MGNSRHYYFYPFVNWMIDTFSISYEESEKLADDILSDVNPMENGISIAKLQQCARFEIEKQNANKKSPQLQDIRCENCRKIIGQVDRKR